MALVFHEQNRRFKTGNRLVQAVATLSLLLMAGGARADAPADELLARVQDTLQHAQSLSASFTTTTLHPTRYSDTLEKGTLTLARPNQARLAITRYRKPVDADRWIASGNGSLSVTDGSSAWTLITHPASAQYRQTPAAAVTPARLLDSLPLLRGFFGTEATTTEAQTRLVGTRTWEGKRYSVVEVTGVEKAGAAKSAGQSQAQTTRELWIGDDSLIHRQMTRTRTAGKTVSVEVALRNLHLDETVPAGTFAFAPPPGAVPFERSAPQPLLAVGTEAPDFQVEDTNSRPVRLSDFRGKIVVLKFFATWCWTCKQSLPDTNHLAQAYADKDVVVLAVDIWNSRKAFAAWTARTPYRAIRFAHDDRPQGKDTASALYHVTATPTEFVIGKDGKIAASSTGYEGRNTKLEQTVQTLSAGQQTAAR